MTKEITKAFILQQLQDKMGLREFASSPFLFDETVVPVYNIEQHLMEWWQEYVTVSITAMGGVPFFIVPEDEKWTLRRYDVVFMTGNFTIAGVYIERKNRTPGGAYVYLDLKAAQNTSYHIETDVVLTRGDKVYVNVDGYTTTGNLRLYADYLMEKIR